MKVTVAREKGPRAHGFDSDLWRNRDVQALIKRKFDIYHSGAAPVKTGHEERLNFEVVLRLCLSPALTWNPLKF